MALPVIPLAIQTKEVDGTKYKLKPFTVGQENLILLMKDSKSPNEIYEAVVQLIDECWVGSTGSDKIEDLPPYVIDMLFLKLRTISNGEVMKLDMQCNGLLPKKEDEEQKTCLQRTPIEVNLEEVSILRPEGYNNFYTIGDESGIGIKLKELSLKESLVVIKQDMSQAEMMSRYVEMITSGDEVFPTADIPSEELVQWCEGIPASVKIEIVRDFFNKLPTILLEHKFQCKNPDCKKDHTLKFTSLLDFFI